MDIATKTVLYQIPGMDEVSVERNVEYAPSLVLDVYRPVGQSNAVVVFVAGYPDPGFERMVGCKFKDMGSTTSWARLIAASGMTAIAYSNRDPEPDLHAVLAHLSANFDANRIGLWASSGNAALAISALDRAKCAALLYPMTLDLDGSNWVSSAAAMFRFANPAAGKSVADLPANVPLFIARAGRDEIPNLKNALDRFVTHALAHNLPLTLVNHPEGPHAFDLMHDSDTTREIVRRTLSFLRDHLIEAS